MPPAGASAHSPTTAASASGSAGWTCQNTPGREQPLAPGRALHRPGPSARRRARRRRRRRPPRPRRPARTGAPAPAAARRAGRAGSPRSAARRGCGARAARPGRRSSTASRTRCRQPSGAAGQLLDRAPPARSRPAGAAARRSTAAFSSRCAAGSACCKSQPPQPPARAHAHGAGTRPRRGLQHGHRVGPAERAAAVLGDDGAHPLARQRVPDEHHPPLVSGRRSARRARPAPTSSSSTRSVQSSAVPAAHRRRLIAAAAGRGARGRRSRRRPVSSGDRLVAAPRRAGRGLRARADHPLGRRAAATARS